MDPTAFKPVSQIGDNLQEIGHANGVAPTETSQASGKPSPEF